MHPNPEPVVENATPSLEIELQMQPLRSKLVQGSAENATPSSEIGGEREAITARTDGISNAGVAFPTAFLVKGLHF